MNHVQLLDKQHTEALNKTKKICKNCKYFGNNVLGNVCDNKNVYNRIKLVYGYFSPKLKKGDDYIQVFLPDENFGCIHWEKSEVTE